MFFAGQALLNLAVEVIRMKVAAAPDSTIFRNDCFIKTPHSRRELLCPVVGVAGQVPLADYTGRIACIFQRLGDCDIICRKMILVVGAKIIGDSHPGRVLPRH